MLQWRVNMLALLTLKPSLRGDAALALRLTAGARPCPIRAIAVSGDDAAGWVDDLRPARPGGFGTDPFHLAGAIKRALRTIARVDSIKTQQPREWLHEYSLRATVEASRPDTPMREARASWQYNTVSDTEEVFSRAMHLCGAGVPATVTWPGDGQPGVGPGAELATRSVAALLDLGQDQDLRALMLFVAAAARPNAVMTSAWTFSESQRAHAVAALRRVCEAEELAHGQLMEPLDAPALCLDALLREQARVGDKSSGKGRPPLMTDGAVGHAPVDLLAALFPPAPAPASASSAPKAGPVPARVASGLVAALHRQGPCALRAGQAHCDRRALQLQPDARELRFLRAALPSRGAQRAAGHTAHSKTRPAGRGGQRRR
jgi:hypothetical protein